MVGEIQYCWEEHYLAAILTRLPEQIGKAQAAIAGRRQELASDHGGPPMNNMRSAMPFAVLLC